MGKTISKNRKGEKKPLYNQSEKENIDKNSNNNEQNNKNKILNWIKNNKDTIAIILASLTLIFALFSFFYSNHRNDSIQDRLENMEYIRQAQQNRPYLKIIGNPIISKFYILRDKKAIKNLMRKHFALNHSFKNLPLPGIPVIEFKLKLFNANETPAEILGYACMDSVTGVGILRDETILNRLPMIPEKDQLSTESIIKGDTTELEFSHYIFNLGNNTFIIHALVIYRNETGIVFDTYYWAKYKTPEAIINWAYSKQTSSINYSIIDSELEFIEGKMSSQIYNPESSFKINERLDNFWKKFDSKEKEFNSSWKGKL